MYTIIGPEFGPDEGKMSIIVRDFYGLRISGASLQNYLVKYMHFMGYKTYLDEPDLWMRPIKISHDGFKHYEYVLIYVKDFLVIGYDTTEVLQNIDRYFGLKPGYLSDQDIYLSTKLKMMRMENGVVAWSLIPLQYIQEAANNMERYVKDNLGDRWNIPKTDVNPFPHGYEPPIGILLELDLVL